MRQNTHTIAVATQGPGLIDITERAVNFVAASNVTAGLLTLFIRHTSASLVIQENADSDVLRDLEDFFLRLVLRDTKSYRHTAEGPDDMPAHIRAALTQTSLSIPVEDSTLMLGTWQAVYLFEHRDTAHRRKVAAHLIGE